jgi:hypothetical protein
MRGPLGGAILLLIAAASSGQTPATGRISGQVTVTSRARGTPLSANAYLPRAVGRHQGTPAPEIRNVVVYLKDAPYRGTLSPSRAEIRQGNGTFLRT